MTCRPIWLCLALGLILGTSSADPKKKTLPPIDEIVFNEKLWDSYLEAHKTPDPKETKAERELREKLKQKDINIGLPESEGLNWLSSDHDALRAAPGSYTLLNRKVGEIVIRGRDRKPVDATISLFNRGDDGEISIGNYEKLLNDWKLALDDKLATRAEPRSQKGAVQVSGWMWKKGNTAILLEGSHNRSERRAEFIRLRFASISAARNAPSGVGRRGSFTANVKKDDAGFTYIEGIPMVDQGDKGYCVVASVERVANYFGAQVDQHELAQVANTGEHGTNGNDMEKAFQRLTGRIHLRTVKHIEYDDRQLEKDIRGYNRLAKKEGVRVFNYDPDDYYIDPLMFWSRADIPTFRSMKASQAGFAHFNRKIKEYVDQGIPLCWTLYLGMFKEEGIPQTFGGHMRLITGYNEKSGEIYYTDSWGKGHERKKMRADEAYCMTMALYTMLPSN